MERWTALAVFGPAAGVLACTLIRRFGPERAVARAAAAAGLVLLAFGLCSSGVLGRLPDTTRAAAAVAGAFGVAGALGGTRVSSGLVRAAALVLLARFLDGAASGWEILGPAPPWSAEWAGRLLDASPSAFVMEAGGVDWMRHPSVYDPVGTDRIGPGIRSGYAGTVAANVLLVVGCISTALAAMRGQGRATPCQLDNSSAPSPRSSSPSR